MPIQPVLVVFVFKSFTGVLGCTESSRQILHLLDSPKCDGRHDSNNNIGVANKIFLPTLTSLIADASASECLHRFLGSMFVARLRAETRMESLHN